MKPEELTSEQWQEIIVKLEDSAKSLPPEDKSRFDIFSVIQYIQADPLGGDFGHAQYFLEHPEGKVSNLTNIVKVAKRFVPDLEVET